MQHPRRRAHLAPDEHALARRSARSIRPGNCAAKRASTRAEGERPQRAGRSISRGHSVGIAGGAVASARARPVRAASARRRRAARQRASSGPCRATLRAPETIAWRGAGCVRSPPARRPRRRRAPSTTMPIASCCHAGSRCRRASRPTSSVLRTMLPARTATPTKAGAWRSARSGRPRQQAMRAGAEPGHPDHLHARARRVDDDQPAVDEHRAAFARGVEAGETRAATRLASAVTTRSG